MTNATRLPVKMTGAMTALGLFVLPALGRLGPDGPKVITQMLKSGIHTFMASIAGLTILSGLYLYWHFTNGFDPTISRSAGGMMFGIGAVLGIVAGALGGRIGRVMKGLEAAGATLATTTDAAARTRVEGEVSDLRAKAATLSHVVLVLLLITIVLMALGHYV